MINVPKNLCISVNSSGYLSDDMYSSQLLWVEKNCFNSLSIFFKYSKPEEVPFDGGKPYTPPPTPVTAEADKSGEGGEEEAMGYFQKLAEEA